MRAPRELEYILIMACRAKGMNPGIINYDGQIVWTDCYWVDNERMESI